MIKNDEVNKNYEYLNSEYQNIYGSTEYKLGRKILDIKNNLSHGHVIKTIKGIMNIFKSNKRVKLSKEEVYSADCPIQIKKRVAIYTCITGSYDTIQEPLYIEENCDYYIITNNKKIKSNIWKIIDVSNHPIKDDILLNRYIKFHPSEFFNDYDYTVYIDGNIQIVSNISGYTIHCNQVKTGIAMHTHSTRDCVYDEIQICKMYKKADIDKLNKIFSLCKKSNVEKHFGLFECGVIVIDINNHNARKLLEFWWQEFSTNDCRRDQILLPYILKKLSFTASDIGVLGNNIYRNAKFKIKQHSK